MMNTDVPWKADIVRRQIGRGTLRLLINFYDVANPTKKYRKTVVMPVTENEEAITARINTAAQEIKAQILLDAKFGDGRSVDIPD